MSAPAYASVASSSSTTSSSSSSSSFSSSADSSLPILFRQLNSAYAIDYHNRKDDRVIVTVTCAILAEAIRLRKLIENPSDEVKRQITQLQQVHDRFLVELDANTWNLLRDPAFLTVGSGMTQANYDRIIAKTIDKHNLRLPPPARPRSEDECGGGGGGSGDGLGYRPQLDTDAGIADYLNQLNAQAAGTYPDLPLSLVVQLSCASSLTDSAELPRAVLALVEEAIRVRTGITPQPKHEIEKLREAHQRFSVCRSMDDSASAWKALSARVWHSVESALPRDVHDRVISDAIKKYQLEFPKEMRVGSEEDGQEEQYE